MVKYKPLPDSSANILIVDDLPDNLRLLSCLLRDEGYQVRAAISGPAAMMAVRSLIPDLILLDVRMPGQDGYSVCEALKEEAEYQDIPIIFLSAYNSVADKVKAFDVGGVDYITKPFHTAEVLARISTHLALRQSQKQLQDSKKQVELTLQKEKYLNQIRSQFVSMISHDFRTPLTTIQGFSSLFKASLGDLSESQQIYFLDKIEMAVDQLLEMLDRVLLVSRAENQALVSNPQVIDLQTFCLGLLEDLQVSCQKTHELRFLGADSSCHVTLDPKLLRTILDNLLSNAIKYSPQGGTVWLILDCQPEVIRLEVKDSGIGIPVENQTHLFEDFYRANNIENIPGTGLGLAIVKKCVEAHQGTIEVQSQEGQGTSFVVTLPVLSGSDTCPT